MAPSMSMSTTAARRPAARALLLLSLLPSACASQLRSHRASEAVQSHKATKFQQQKFLRLRKAVISDDEQLPPSGEAWQPCADEGQAVPRAGRVRFGFGASWIEAPLPSGASCSVSTFGGTDPVPFIRKVCECAVGQTTDSGGEEVRDELGIRWRRCATEGEGCTCDSGAMRFGLAQRWVVSEHQAASANDDGSGARLCASSSFYGQDPVPGYTKECWCQEQAEGAAALPRERVAVVMLSRHPPNLHLWMRYHVGYMGVEHVFMQVEDTPAFNSTFAALPVDLQQRITVWRGEADVAAANAAVTGGASLANMGQDNRPIDDYDTLQYRQIRVMSHAKQVCEQMGIGWLIHIDDDELLHAPMHRPVGEILAAMPQGFSQAYIPNTEAVYSSAETTNCFQSVDEIDVNPYKFSSYANGKAAVRISDPVARPAGPHQWRDTQNRELPSIHLDREPFGAPLIVVHFESCPFTRWKDKFWNLGNADPVQVSKIPFRFYRESIQRMQMCKEQADLQNQGYQQPQALGQCSDSALKSFWASWKTEANPSVTKSDVMPLRIEWDAVMASSD